MHKNVEAQQQGVGQIEECSITLTDTWAVRYSG